MCAVFVSFAEMELLRESEAAGVGDEVAFLVSVATGLLDIVGLTLAECERRRDFVIVRSAVKDVGGIFVLVSGPTIDCVILRDRDGVLVRTGDGVLGASKEGVATIVWDAVGVPFDKDLDCVKGAVKVFAGLTVSVAILDKVSEAVLVMSSVIEGVATREREADVLIELVSDRESDMVVVSVKDFVADSPMVLDSLISRESVAETETDVVAVMVADKLCEADKD